METCCGDQYVLPRHHPSPEFSRNVTGAPDPPRGLLSIAHPVASQPDSRVCSALRRKEISSQGPCRRLLARLRCRLDAHEGSGMLTGFPFDGRDKCPISNGVCLSLRNGSPMSNCCRHGTFLHFSPQSSHLNSCYSHQDLHWGPLHARSRKHFNATPTPCYTSTHTRADGQG